MKFIASVFFLFLAIAFVFSVDENTHFGRREFKLLPKRAATRIDESGTVKSDESSQYNLETVPGSTAVYIGQEAIFQCSGPSGSDLRIQWWELTSQANKQPQLISDQTQLLLSHPNVDKYDIQQPDNDTYNLIIHNVQLTDVGTYTCLDASSGPPCFNISDDEQGSSASAELIVFDGQPNCQTTISSTGEVAEGDYHTTECIIYFKGYIAPTITWTGPPPYTVNSQTGVDFVWSGIEVYVNRSMNAQQFTAVSKFGDSISWQFTFSTPVLLVSYDDRKYFRIRSTLCNKDLCAGPNSPIVICENGSGSVWFQSSNNIMSKTDDTYGFDGEGNLFHLNTFVGAIRQFWFIYNGNRIANRRDANEVVDLTNSNCANGAEIQRLPYNGAQNQKWDFVYIN